MLSLMVFPHLTAFPHVPAVWLSHRTAPEAGTDAVRCDSWERK